MNEYTPAVLSLGQDDVDDRPCDDEHLQWDTDLEWDTDLGPEKIAPGRDHNL